MRTSTASWGEPGALVVLVIWFLCMSSVTGTGACMRRRKTGVGKRQGRGKKTIKVSLLTADVHIMSSDIFCLCVDWVHFGVLV